MRKLLKKILAIALVLSSLAGFSVISFASDIFDESDYPYEGHFYNVNFDHPKSRHRKEKHFKSSSHFSETFPIIKYGQWVAPSGDVVFYPYIRSYSDDDCVSDGYINWVRLEIPENEIDMAPISESWDSESLNPKFQFFEISRSHIFTTYSPFKDQNGETWALSLDRGGFEPYEGPYGFVWSKKLQAYVYSQDPRDENYYWDEDSESYIG